MQYFAFLFSRKKKLFEIGNSKKQNSQHSYWQQTEGKNGADSHWNLSIFHIFFCYPKLVELFMWQLQRIHNKHSFACAAHRSHVHSFVQFIFKVINFTILTVSEICIETKISQSIALRCCRPPHSKSNKPLQVLYTNAVKERSPVRRIKLRNKHKIKSHTVKSFQRTFRHFVVLLWSKQLIKMNRISVYEKGNN